MLLCNIKLSSKQSVYFPQYLFNHNQKQNRTKFEFDPIKLQKHHATLRNILSSFIAAMILMGNTWYVLINRSHGPQQFELVHVSITKP